MSRLITGPEIPVPLKPMTGAIFPGNFESLFDILGPAQTGFSGATWPAANRAIFLPFEIASPRIVTQVAWFNGSTITSVVDAGVYTTAGVRLVSIGGSGVAQSGASVIQVADLTDTYLAPGVYYMAIALDSTGGALVRWNPTLQWMIATGIQQASTAFVLPDPVTLANPATAYIPAMALGLHAVL